MSQVAHQTGPLISSICSIIRLGVFLLPLDGKVGDIPSIQIYCYPFLHLDGKRGTVRVKCLVQEHNTISPARALTRTA